MNIKVQACGLVLLIVLYLLYHRKRTLPTYSKRAYVRLYCLTVCCITMDILSIMAIEYASVLPGFFVRSVCKGYLMTLILAALGGVQYIGVDILLYDRDFRRGERAIVFAAAGICTAIVLLPIEIYHDPVTHQVYTYGSAPTMTYLGAVSLILLNLFLILRYRNQIRARRRRAMLLWMLLWMGSALLQFFFAELLVVGFGSCLGVVIIYLQFENPEINLDRASGMYNQTAFYEFIRQIFYDRAEYAAFVFVNEHRFSGNESQAAMQSLEKVLLGTPKVNVFRTADDEIVALLERSEQKERDVAWIQQYITERLLRFDRGNVIRVLYLEDCLLTVHPDEFFALLRYCRRKKISRTMQRFLTVGSADVERMIGESDLLQKVDEAILMNRIEVYYQPIYSVRQGIFTSAEALVRLFDARGNMLPVYDSICASEENGRIDRIGEIVFEKVCQMLSGEQPEQYGLRYVEVNLSAEQCSEQDLAERYIRIMERYNVAPDRINLEITESAAVGARQTLLANMQRLISYGVSFSLDDFGTGQSNLNYIVEMPVQLVKFDREMTQAYFKSEKGRFVMDATMHMIQDMKLGIVSEGIESKEQFEEMERLQIDYIQGFYFSRPLPLYHFLHFLQEHQH